MRRISRHWSAKFVLALAIVGVGFAFHGARASAAGCANTTEFGSVTNITVSIPNPGSYRVWSRIIPGASNNTYLLDVDGISCYTVGGTNVAAGTSWQWVDFQQGGSKINHNFATAGNHTIKLYGTGDGLQLDRVIFTQDTAGTYCNVQMGTGDNCANPPDTTPPTTSFATPATDNANVSGTYAIKVNASDTDSQIKTVELFIDGQSKGNLTLSAGTYNYSWDTLAPGVANGTHTLKVKATDNAGNFTEVTRPVSVLNGQPDLYVSLVSKSPATVKAGDAVTFSAVIKNKGLLAAAPGSVRFNIGSIFVQTVSSATVIAPGDTVSQTITLPTTWSAIAGNQTMTVTVDSTGVVAESNESNNSATLNFAVDSVDTTAPVVSVTSPAANANLLDTNTQTITATATDAGTGVSTVVFYDGASVIGSGTKSGNNYSVVWNTKNAATGSHILKAVATDVAGNVKTSATVTVTVSKTVVPDIPGDFDLDGQVDFDDLDILSRNWQQPNRTRATGDANGDGRVDFDDLDILSRNWSA